ncbi:MAG: DUF202 domain-containing protein [Pseudonocardiaceae bacterium]
MTDPDYRFTLANERTLLAWLRTALALLAAGVAVVHLVPDLGLPGARRVIGTTLAGLSATVAITSMLRWRAVQAAMRRDDELPPSRAPLLLSISLAVLSLLVLVLLALRGGPGCTPRRATRVASATHPVGLGADRFGSPRQRRSAALAHRPG